VVHAFEYECIKILGLDFWSILLPRAGFRGQGARAPTSHYRGASHRTAHILFLANESADDFFIDAFLQFASTEIVKKHLHVLKLQCKKILAPKYDFWRALGEAKKFSRLTIARHILHPSYIMT